MNGMHLPTSRLHISGLICGDDSLKTLRFCLLEGQVDDENLVLNDAFWKKDLPKIFEFSLSGPFLPFALRKYLVSRKLSFVWVGQDKTTKDGRIDIFDGQTDECHQITLVKPINKINLLPNHPELEAKAKAIFLRPFMYAPTAHAALKAQRHHHLSGVFS